MIIEKGIEEDCQKSPKVFNKKGKDPLLTTSLNGIWECQNFGRRYPVISAYNTAWTMLYKIRRAMENRDTQYALAGIIELDDAFFGAPTEGGKRGRGTERWNV